MGNLDFPTAVEEIKAAAAYLKAEGAPKVRHRHLRVKCGNVISCYGYYVERIIVH